MNAAQHVLILGVHAYRWTLSPAQRFLFGPGCGCRFEPSCSEYALEAVRMRGALAGSWLALKRICRCHPWGGCGEDPVPEGKREVRSAKCEVRSWGRHSKISDFLNLFRISGFGFRISTRQGKHSPSLH